MRNSHPPDLRLESVLERHLGQVAAPDELWGLIQRARQSPALSPTRPARKPFAQTSLFVSAALMLLAAGIWNLVPRHTDQALSIEALAIQALAREPEDLDLRSDTVSEIRTWAKSRTGLDIPLPSRTSRVIRLTGVCAVKGGTPAIELAYRVDGRNAALMVSKARLLSAGSLTFGDVRHRFLKCESIGGTRVSSWIMRGQLYTLAYAPTGQTRDECLLCHDGAPQVTFSN